MSRQRQEVVIVLYFYSLPDKEIKDCNKSGGKLNNMQGPRPSITLALHCIVHILYYLLYFF